MKTKSILLISIGVVLATLKVCHKNRDRMNGWPMFGGGEDKTEYMSSREIKKYVQGSWKSRNTYPDAKIEIQGQTLILTRGESRMELAMAEVGNYRIDSKAPDFYTIELFHSKDAIIIYYFTKDESETFIEEYYDRIEN